MFILPDVRALSLAGTFRDDASVILSRRSASRSGGVPWYIRTCGRTQA